MSQFNFQAEGVDTSDDFPAMPLDWYPVIITEVEDSPNAKANGRYLIVKVAITGNGQFAGATMRTWINYEHANDKCQELGIKALAKICQSVGIGQLTDTDHLINKTLDAKIGPQKDSTYNEIKDWRQSEQLGFSDMEDPGLGSKIQPPAGQAISGDTAAQWPGSQ